jgi:glyoxylase-like metal-dependent hydrolase (beta-lactamase superfamily II)
MEIYRAPTGKPYEDWQAVFGDAQPMPWTAFNTGYISGVLKNNAQPDSFPPNRDPTQRYDYAVMAFHFRHPIHGDILIDTGFDRTFHEHPPYGNLSPAMRVYYRLTKVQCIQKSGDINLKSQLERHQIAPAQVFLTHLHSDHTAGLPSVPSNCRIYCGARERSMLSKLLCGNHFAGKPSLHLLDSSTGVALEPFSHVVDVFGDGTFWALSTPGHTRDHLAYLINTSSTPVLIVGDAELTTWAMKDEILVSTMDGERGKKAVLRSAKMIRAFHAMYPQVQIWFSHDEDHLST